MGPFLVGMLEKPDVFPKKEKPNPELVPEPFEESTVSVSAELSPAPAENPSGVPAEAPLSRPAEVPRVEKRLKPHVLPQLQHHLLQHPHRNLQDYLQV